MKKVTLPLLLSLSFLGIYLISFEDETTKKIKTIHKQAIHNNPFKKTLELSKEERKK